MDAKNFWIRVKKLIKDNKTSQKALAEYLGIPLRTVINWIYRGIFPLITEGYLISKYFGVSIDYLLTGKEKKSGVKIDSIRSLLKQADDRLKKL